MIQDVPYELDPINWAPLVIFEKALIFSADTQSEGYRDGLHTIQTYREVSLDAIKFVIEAYLEDDEIENMDYLLDGLAVLMGVHRAIIRAG